MKKQLALILAIVFLAGLFTARAGDIIIQPLPQPIQILEPVTIEPIPMTIPSTYSGLAGQVNLAQVVSSLLQTTGVQATLTLWAKFGNRYYRLGDFRTAKDGFFILWLPPGNYRLSVDSPADNFILPTTIVVHQRQITSYQLDAFLPVTP